MYHWQFSILDYVFTGRTWDDFLYFLDEIIDIYKLTPHKRIIVWVHNLSYEFQWLKTLLTIENNGDYDKGYFLKEPRKALSITHKSCIEFRDSMAISNSSLAKLSDIYNLPHKKAVGDLDHTKARNSKTPLDDTELNYCIMDVVVLADFSNYYWETYLSKKKMPITSTAIILQDKKEHIKNSFGLSRWNCAIKSLYPDEATYKYMIEECFRGGYCHANIIHIGVLLENVYSYDITSSYPYVMLSYKFPMSKFHRVKGSKGFEEHIKKGHHVIFTATFTNLRNTTTHSLESLSKCRCVKNPIVDNGRILSADQIEVTLTEVDYEMYKKFYTWDIDTFEVLGYLYAEVSDYIPKDALTTLINNYERKAYLKANDQPYNIEKAKVNSEYGACVKTMHKNDVILDFETGLCDKVPTETSFEEFAKKQILLPQWGLYITSFARARVLEAIFNLKDDQVYTDTDSVKFLNVNNCKWFEDENARILEENKEMCNRLGCDYNIFYDLGTWSCESGKSGYKLFKTLGAKRYIYTDENDKTHCTVAGIPKNAIIDTYKTTDSIYSHFENGMYIEVSGKLTPKYYDAPRTEEITDYLGNTETMYESSSQTLNPTDFTLTMDRNWIFNVVKSLQDKYRHNK